MYFEFGEEWRKLESRTVHFRWGSQLVVVMCISGGSQADGGECGHTCGDKVGTRAEVVMSKIESWLRPGDNGRRPQSELHGAESFDEDHRPTALWTSPKRPRCGSSFFRRLGFENPT